MISRIVCIRHAKPKVEGYASDELYPLSEEGITQHKKLAKILKEKKYFPDKIYCSPVLRAVESAVILSESFGVPFVKENALGDDFNTDRLLDCIPKKDHTLFFVGHAPTLANFFEALIGKKVLKDGIGKSCAAVCEFSDQIGYKKAYFIEYINPNP